MLFYSVCKSLITLCTHLDRGLTGGTKARAVELRTRSKRERNRGRWKNDLESYNVDSRQAGVTNVMTLDKFKNT